jgi:hypothetical protein
MGSVFAGERGKLFRVGQPGAPKGGWRSCTAAVLEIEEFNRCRLSRSSLDYQAGEERKFKGRW